MLASFALNLNSKQKTENKKTSIWNEQCKIMDYKGSNFDQDVDNQIQSRFMKPTSITVLSERKKDLRNKEHKLADAVCDDLEA